MAIIKKIFISVSNPAGGQKVSLYGGFAQNPTTSAIEFHAVSLRIPQRGWYFPAPGMNPTLWNRHPAEHASIINPRRMSGIDDI